MCYLQDMPPHSLIEAHAGMNAKYPDDRFDIWPRMAPSGEQEWRVKCLDCPGKVCSNCVVTSVPGADH
jgi:SWI/SNF-related matrix-associated actin-dependent regulator of chromatin subfamily B member 1